MKHIVKKDGINSMIKIFDIDNEMILDEWLGKHNVDK